MGPAAPPALAPLSAPALRAALAGLADAADDAIDPVENALLMGALSCPTRDLAPYRAHLDALGEAVAQVVAAAPEQAETAHQRGAILRQVLTQDQGDHGDVENYEDPGNANLLHVIDTRRGLPITLGLLWLSAARAQGWQADALNFPGHFLIRLMDEDGERVILDPFHDGQDVSVADLRALLKALTTPDAELTPEVWAALGNRDMLLRLQNNVKLRHLERGNAAAALEAVTLMLLLSPQDHRLWRESGLMHMRLGDLEGAMAALDTYLDLAPPGPDRTRIDDVLRELRQRLV